MVEKAHSAGRLPYISIPIPNIRPIFRQWGETIVGFEPQVFTDFRVVALNKVTEKDRDEVAAVIGKYKSISIEELGTDGLNKVVKFGAKRRLEEDHRGINFVANVINEVRERATDVRLATNVVFPADRQKFLANMGSPMYTHVPGPKADLIDKVIRTDAINRLGLANGIRGVATTMASRARDSAVNTLREVAYINPLKIDFPVVVTYKEIQKHELDDEGREALARYQSQTGGVHSPNERIDRRYFDKDGNRAFGEWEGPSLKVPDSKIKVADETSEVDSLWRHRELHLRWGFVNLYVPITPNRPTTSNEVAGHHKRNQPKIPIRHRFVEKFRTGALKAA